MGGGEGFHVDHDDQAVRGALVLDRGELMWPAPKIEPSPQRAAKVEAKPAAPVADPAARKSSPAKTVIVMALLGLVLGGLGLVAPKEFLSHFTVFVLACFVGWQVVWNVTPALHTPLMSVTNAISGIIIVGGMLQVAHPSSNELSLILGGVAVLLASINIAGGFLVTQRMLRMFQKVSFIDA